MVDWRLPVGSHRWLARPHMTLPLSPQPLPTSPLRLGSTPVAFSLASSLLVPTLPAAKNTLSAVTVLVAVDVAAGVELLDDDGVARRRTPARPR